MLLIIADVSSTNIRNTQKHDKHTEMFFKIIGNVLPFIYLIRKSFAYICSQLAFQFKYLKQIELRKLRKRRNDSYYRFIRLFRLFSIVWNMVSKTLRQGITVMNLVTYILKFRSRHQNLDLWFSFSIQIISFINIEIYAYVWKCLKYLNIVYSVV